MLKLLAVTIWILSFQAMAEGIRLTQNTKENLATEVLETLPEISVTTLGNENAATVANKIIARSGAVLGPKCFRSTGPSETSCVSVIMNEQSVLRIEFKVDASSDLLQILEGSIVTTFSDQYRIGRECFNVQTEQRVECLAIGFF